MSREYVTIEKELLDEILDTFNHYHERVSGVQMFSSRLLGRTQYIAFCKKVGFLCDKIEKLLNRKHEKTDDSFKVGSYIYKQEMFSILKNLVLEDESDCELKGILLDYPKVQSFLWELIDELCEDKTEIKIECDLDKDLVFFKKLKTNLEEQIILKTSSNIGNNSIDTLDSLYEILLDVSEKIEKLSNELYENKEENKIPNNVNLKYYSYDCVEVDID